MARGRFDSEYDKVRKAAGFARPQYEFPDDSPDAHGRKVADRVGELNEDFKARMVELHRAEAERLAAAMASHAEFRREVDRRIMIREWRHLGLDPPDPLYSVDLALSIGCRIEQGLNGPVLVRAQPPSKPPKTREDYGNVEGS